MAKPKTKAIHVTVEGHDGQPTTQEFLITDERGRLRYRIIAYEEDPELAIRELIDVCRQAYTPNLRVVD